ncbi:NADPH-dependent FMN reductase [Ornithinibacillus scapharcae]|uniref:NADPH-dependent FMN reductase n=1 Tax=Ornithinibacillus scapharcae TaxID=1147159 RepID=UPI000225B2F9|nr:NADPH-dependent FMN reductase [Ornithinibacillus scapharcae]
MRIITLVGSIRKESYNMKIARFMQERYADQLDMHIADIRSLPFFDQDIELDPPQVVKDFKSSIANADGVLIITPEYNWSVPGVLKNALDWTSRVERVLLDKPVMPLGATPGMMGTIRAQLHLREILVAPGIQAKVLPPGANEILINQVTQKLDVRTDTITDQTTIDFLDSKVEAFIKFIESQR